MQILKKIISIQLIILIFCYCFPVYQSEDINKDSKVDLHDAIKVVKSVAEDAQHRSGNFRENIIRAVSTLTLAAGLKTVIKTNNSISNMGYSLMDNPFFIDLNLAVVLNHTYWYIQAVDTLFKSHIISPGNRPPRLQTNIIA